MISIKEKIPKINIMILLFIAFILSNYNFIENVHYLLFIIIIIFTFFELGRGIKLSQEIIINKILLLFIILMFSAFFIRSLTSYYEFKHFIVYYSVIYIVFIYGTIKYVEFGSEFGKQFYRQFTWIMNLLSFLNLYQIFFNKPALIPFLTERVNKYQSFAYETDQFRTISVFGHPIVSGVFFSLLFICNIYILKGKIKFPLQVLALLNIYSTSSRSGWIALVIVMLFYFSKAFFTGKIPIKKVIITKRNLLTVYTSFLFLTTILVVILLNINIIISSIIERFGDSLKVNSNDISNLQRVGTIELILKQMFNGEGFHLLLGNGTGKSLLFMLNNTVVIPGFTATDNTYLTIFFELGIFAIISYLVFIFISFYRFIYSNGNWLHELSSLCFLFISIVLFFLEGKGWGTVVTLWSFTLLTLILTFNKNKMNNV